MPTDRPPPSKLRAWLQLFRVPNLFTVPGDPLAGFLLAWDEKRPPFFLLSAVLASLCFYSAGLLLNDLADIAEDRIERPMRPLPSGAVKTGTVWIVAILLLSAALAISVSGGALAVTSGCAIVIALSAYNFGLKKIAFIGPMT